MLKFRVLQVSYFIISAIEIVFESIGFAFMTLANPLDKITDKMLNQISKIAKELDEIEEEKENE